MMGIGEVDDSLCSRPNQQPAILAGNIQKIKRVINRTETGFKSREKPHLHQWGATISLWEILLHQH